MTRQSLQKLRIRGEWLLRSLSRRRGLLLRALLCWAIGCLALSGDEVGSYDQRFHLRGNQTVREEVVLLTLYPSDFLRVYSGRPYAMRDLSEITDITDSFFWDKVLWKKLLSQILRQQPRSIGVTLWFGENIGDVKLTPAEREVFMDGRVIWSTSINNVEKVMSPAFASADLTNIGSGELTRDDDGTVRRIFTDRGEVPHMVERLTARSFDRSPNGFVINYRGSSKAFARYTLNDLLNDDLPPDVFKNKIILIGTDLGSGPRYATPVGPLPRAEVLAHLVDNHLENRWIKRLSFGVYAGIYFLLTILSVFLITTYPQSVVLLFFIWIGTLGAALSAWAFDTYALWFPAFSPFVLLSATWIIFIGYQATRVERLNQRLQQERLYLQELEQLKNNFVSLISHDLKTPIAKIQAVINRLQTQNVSGPLEEDLRSLHDSSEELNKYIQSILKLLRVESRDFKVQREVADINEVIEEVVQQLRPLAVHSNIRLEMDLEPMFSSEFDVTLMKEVVLNLIENGIKYSLPGGLVHIRSEEVDDVVRVEVRDEGVGIAPNEIDRIWHKFVRGREQDLKTKGSGLGLYLVKYFIELHGGSVEMRSEVGKGSTVSFTLPIVDDSKVGPTDEVPA